jgi:hypothetical protein
MPTAGDVEILPSFNSQIKISLKKICCYFLFFPLRDEILFLNPKEIAWLLLV